MVARPATKIRISSSPKRWRPTDKCGHPYTSRWDLRNGSKVCGDCGKIIPQTLTLTAN